MVDRYDVTGDCDLDVTPGGWYVLASDYDALAARLAEAERQLDDVMHQLWHAVYDPENWLRFQGERVYEDVKKARDLTAVV